MDKYDITGMSCAACQARIEKEVSKLDGVKTCSVSLLTNTMNVEGTASVNEIIKAVEDAGYGATLSGSKKTKTDNDTFKDTETPKMKKRLIASLIFLAVLMYISMGHMMWGWPLPSFLEHNHMAMGMAEMLLTIVVMVINQKFFINGFKGLVHLSPNMDTLIALGSGAAFIYSTAVLFMMSDAVMMGNDELVMTYMHDLYFESAAMILTLITVGKMLESRSKGKTTDALRSLMKLKPSVATVIRNNIETVIGIDEVVKGDIVIVKPGESIPVDGIIIEGDSAIDESMLTGESIPIDKTVNDRVSEGTLNQHGYLKIKTTGTGDETALSKIISTVSDASASKAPIARIADKVSLVFVPAVITIAVITIIVWLMLGESIGFALARGISVLVISCPCALGLATPVAIMVGNGMGAKNGILFKTAESLEETGKVKTVVLDKTGTVTGGRPSVTDIIAADGADEDELLEAAYSLEIKSEHPLSKAICDEALKRNMSSFEVTDFKAMPGNGLCAYADEDIIAGGNLKFISSYVNVNSELSNMANSLGKEGKTALYFAKGNRMLGIIAVADTIRDDSKEAVRQLRDMGINVVMLTGDNKNTAMAIAEDAGIENVIAEVKPEDKASVVAELKKQGKTVMVGDGINDAPALVTADIGMAIGAGTDVAIDAADVVLMKDSILDAVGAIRLSRKTLKIIHENLFWAFIYNVIGIPLAAGVFISILGWKMNPMFGAAAMSLSSFSVVSNALRLNFVDIYSDRHDKKIENTKLEIKEIRKMEKTMIIEGMMCPNCEKHVKKALEAIDGVTVTEISHEKNMAKVALAREVGDDVLKNAVTEEGYEVKEIR